MSREAYRLVYIFQCTQEQAGVVMGITPRAVYYLIEGLKKLRPDLFDEKSVHIKRKKPFRFDERRDSQPKYAF